jgi:hypothetical protein
MKKMLALVLALILFAMPAFAVSTLVCTDTKITFVSGVGHKVACTATADSTTFTTLEMKTAAGESINLAGQYLYLVSVVPGGTAPTDNSDLVINEDTSTGVDILSNSGLNMIDNATTNTWRPLSGSVAYSAPVMGPLFVGASGNSVSGAIFILTIRTVPQSP